MRNRKNCKALRSIVLTLAIAALSVSLGICADCITKDAYAATTTGTALPSDSNQATQMENLGLSSEQPVRYSASGAKIDKTKNPLGGTVTILSRTCQLAYSYRSDGSDMLNVYTDPIPSKTVNTVMGNMIISNSIATTVSARSESFNAYHRYLVAVDIDGNGTQEVANVGYVKSDSGYKLQLYVSNYNNLTKHDGGTAPITSNLYTIATVKTYPNRAPLSYSNAAIKCAAGDFDHDGLDEIAIATGESTYVCKVTMTTCKILSTITDYETCDIEALDGNGDGYPELMAIKEGYKATPTAALIIYKGADVTKVSYSLLLKLGNMYFTSASIDLGDAFGDGDRTLVIGGRAAGSIVSAPAISYIKYLPDSDSYETALTKIYSMPTSSSTGFQGIEGNLQIKCANLTTKVEGTPDYVIFGGYIFLYDSAKNAFIRQTITDYTENSDGLKSNSAKDSIDNITDIDPDDDEKAYILQTLVGNFDGNAEGKEQIILLHYNLWDDKEIVYLTKCTVNDDGEIVANLTEKFRKSDDELYNFPSICPVDVYNHDTKLTFRPDDSYFEFSNPVIVAVLGATPYYEELEKKVAILGNVGTTYGTGTEDESSSSKGVTASAGVSFGFEQGVGIFGIELFRVSTETEITNSFEASWGSSTSISKSVAYTNYYNDDAVVLTVVPYDVYIYDATAWNSTTKKYETSKIVMKVPCDMITTMMTVEAYNKAAKSITNAPVIKADVLDHMVGDPRSYPTTSSGLSNVKGNDVLLAGSSDNTSFVGCGVGNSSIEQSITTAKTSTKSYDYSLNVEVSSSISMAGATAGASIGAGFTTNVTISSTASTTRSGSVCSVPSECSQYQFNWAMVAYNYNLKAGDDTQEVAVISYICKPLNKTYPPKIPEDLSVSSQNLNSNQLKWSASDGASGYNVLRSFAKDGTYSIIATLSGKSTNTYTDTADIGNKTCYYKIQAYNSVLAEVTEPAEASGLTVVDIQIQTQPKISYNEDDLLDLSALMVNLVLSNKTTKQVAFSDFDKYNITTSLKNGLQLGADDSGTPINIKYVPASVSINTSSLAVKKRSSYPVDLTVKFTVGTTANAPVLTAGSQLKADMTMENTQSSAIQALTVLALYDKNGTMVQCVTQTVNIGAGATNGYSSSLILPADIDGYIAKVFVWDGTSLSSSGLTPLSEVVQIPD